MRTIRPSSSLANVRYEIRGDLARRAHEMERHGYEIIPLNIGNPGLFGFRTPETMRLAMIENLKSSEAYCHQKGIFPAREAVVMQQQSRGVRGVSADEVFMGNGVSELIDLVLRALLSTDDEVLVPSPDYPLWTAAVTLNRGRAVHYPCRPENGFVPDPGEIEALITSRTRAIVVINPNNPTGAVYSRATLEAIAQIAERHHLVVFSDEIYDQMTVRRRRVRADGDARATARCARRCPACRRSIAPAAIASAGRCSRATSSTRAISRPRWTSCRRCVCAATCRGSGRCRRRSAATRASTS